MLAVIDNWFGWSSLGMPTRVRWLGAPCGLAGLALLYWSHRTLDINYDGTLHLREAHELVTAPPYAWIRHPMYAALHGIALAVTLMSDSLVLGVVWVGGLSLVLIRRVPREETLMTERFGPAYRAYQARTGLLVPRLCGHGSGQIPNA